MNLGTLQFQSALAERIILFNIILAQYAYETENSVSLVNTALLGFIYSSLLNVNKISKVIKYLVPINSGLPINLSELSVSERLFLLTLV